MNNVGDVRSIILLWLSDVELGGVEEAGTEGVAGDLVGGVDTEFAEDVLAVGGDGVDAGEAVGGNLLGGLALCDGADDFGLCGGQQVGLLFLALLAEDGLRCSLTDEASMAADSLQGLA